MADAENKHGMVKVWIRGLSHLFHLQCRKQSPSSQESSKQKKLKLDETLRTRHHEGRLLLSQVQTESQRDISFPGHSKEEAKIRPTDRLGNTCSRVSTLCVPSSRLRDSQVTHKMLVTVTVGPHLGSVV